MRKLTRTFALFLAVFVIASLGGCVSVNLGSQGATGTVWGEGNMITVDFPVESFDQISTNLSFDLVYQNGDCGVQVKLHENLAEYMDISVEDGVLKIRSTKHFNVGRDEQPVLYLSAPTLSALYFAGSVDMSGSDTLTAEHLRMEFSGSADLVLDLDVGTLEIVSTGSSDLELSGRADNLRLHCSGSGDFSALAMETKNTSLTITGSASVVVSCSETLDVVIPGSGSVDYRGNPIVNRTITGAGRVRQIGE